MRRFVQRLFLFAVLTVGVIGGLCAWEIGAEICKYREEIVAPPEATVLLCGDSQPANAVDPAVCPSFFNFSAHGRTLDQDYLVMLDVLRANPGRFRQVVVDVSPVAATWPLDSPLHKMSYAAVYWLLHYLHPQENVRNLEGGVRVARDYLVGGRLRHAWRAIRGRVEFHSSLYGHFTPYDEVSKRINPTLYEGLLKQKARLAKGAADVGKDAPMFRILDKMAAAASASGVEMVVMTTPWNRELIDLCGERELDRFTAKLAEWAQGKGLRHVNLLKESYPDDCWLDANHLNRKGAVTFTRKLERELAGRRIPSPEGKGAAQ